MTTKSELIKSLRYGFENLEYGDDVRLSQLLSRGEMILRRTYGTDSLYYTKFMNRDFPTHRSGAWDWDRRDTINMLDTMLEEIEIDLDAEERGDGSEESLILRSDRVFVVHGHDEAMRESVARVLTKLGLEPIILHEQSDHGRTIIEKFYDYSDVGFAVVLLSPDDTGYANNADPNTAQPRARQNVILELGFFLGKLGRENVTVLHKGNVEIPSDFFGILYTPYEPSGAWPYRLTRELRESGYKVSADDL
jgi:predicted nucleotide-binding protein